MNDRAFIEGRKPDQIISHDPKSGSPGATGYFQEWHIYNIPDREDVRIVRIVTYEYYNGWPAEGGRMVREINSSIQRMTLNELRAPK